MKKVIEKSDCNHAKESLEFFQNKQLWGLSGPICANDTWLLVDEIDGVNFFIL